MRENTKFHHLSNHTGIICPLGLSIPLVPVGAGQLDRKSGKGRGDAAQATVFATKMELHINTVFHILDATEFIVPAQIGKRFVFLGMGGVL